SFVISFTFFYVNSLTKFFIDVKQYCDSFYKNTHQKFRKRFITSFTEEKKIANSLRGISNLF
ncbi:MAG: hypothetical protein L0L20_09125, partial [Lactococcus lactis]|nr:hypothetical protein [Lactococcus lactis]